MNGTSDIKQHVLMDGSAFIRMMQLKTMQSNPDMWDAYMRKSVIYHVPQESFEAASKAMNLQPYEKNRIQNLAKDFHESFDMFAAESVLIPTLDNLQIVKKGENKYFPLVAWRMQLKYPELTMNLASDELWSMCISRFKHERSLG